MADMSPEWKKPADVMNIRRRRRSLRTDLHATRNTDLPSGHQTLETGLPARKAQKRKNPFAKSKDSEKDDVPVGDSNGDAGTEVNRGETGLEKNCFIDVLVIVIR